MFRSFCLFLALIFFASCASTQMAKSGPIKPKPFVTPWEYYQKTRPAVLTEEDRVKVQNVEAVHTTGEDTKSDKTGIIIVGVLVGVLAIGGTVAGILIAKN